MNTPYPQTRRYIWAAEGNVLTYQEALRIARIGTHTKRPEDAPRVQAYQKLLDAVQAVHAKGVHRFPGPKLHRLLCAAALQTGWCTDMKAVQAKRRPPASGAVPEGQRWCYTCARCLPLAVFQARPSKKEITARRWSPYTTRTITRQQCGDCRQSIKRSKIKGAQRAQVQDTAQAFETRPTPALAVRFFEDVIKRHATAAKQGLRYLQPGTPAHAFQSAKLEALTHARDELNRLIDEGQVDTLCDGGTHWMRLVSEDTWMRLVQLHQDCVNTMPRGRAPRL